MRIIHLRDARRAKAMLDGDRGIAEQWVVGEYGSVYRMLRFLTGSREVAEDLTQQTFVEAWQSLGRYRADASLHTWLLRIAYHQYTHWLRDKRATEPLDEERRAPEPSCAAGLATIMLEHALDTLSDDLRSAFVLFYVQEMSINEIASVLQIPRGTVKSRLFAARKALREKLTELADDAVSIGESGEVSAEVHP